MSGIWTTAAELGLCSCHVCGLVSRRSREDGPAHCSRCGSSLHFRKPASVARSWALLIAAYILYIPANLMPIMDTGSLLSYRQDTILSGVVHLWKTGFWGIATIVFIASITIPLLKQHRIITQVAGYGMNVIKLIPSLTLNEEDRAWIRRGFEQVVADAHRVPGAVWDLGRTLASHSLKARSSAA